MLRNRIGPEVFQPVKPPVLGLENMNYNIAVVQDYPEAVLFSLASPHLSPGF